MSSISHFSYGMDRVRTFDESENRSSLEIDTGRGPEYPRFASDPIRNIEISANDILRSGNYCLYSDMSHLKSIKGAGCDLPIPKPPNPDGSVDSPDLRFLQPEQQNAANSPPTSLKDKYTGRRLA
jgi:hypothetical protein